MANMFSTFFSGNRFAKFFQKGRTDQDARELEEIKNAQGASQEELDQGRTNSDYLITPNSSVTALGMNFEQFFGNKIGRVQKYREMSNYPEISNALDMISDEAIVTGPEGDCCSLNMKEEYPQHIEEQIRKEWDYISHDIFSINERAWDLFRKWLIESELYVELVLNSSGNSVIGVKVLPCHTMMPIYTSGKIKNYIQTKRPANLTNDNQYGAQEEIQDVTFDGSQVAYVNYGVTGNNLVDIRGYLESAVRIYNQLKNIEDSLVVSRLTRAPLRRLWNIYTGRMPAGKSAEYMKSLIQKYKKKITYNSENGSVDSSANIMSLTEDYWFSKDDSGNGTTVDSLGGDTAFISEIEDVKYFYSKLFKALKIPQGRWSDPAANNYSTGKSDSSNSREEIKFMKFVERLQRRFKYMILETFITQLKLKGFDDQYTDIHDYDIEFAKSNLFKEYKELEMVETKFTILSQVKDFIYDPINNPTGYFAKEFALKRFIMISDEELEKNNEMLEIEKAQAAKSGKKPSEETATETPSEGGGGTAFGGGESAPAPTEEAPTEPESTMENVPVESVILKSKLLSEWNSDVNSIKS